MKPRSPFAAAGMVLGAVACILMLAILAARGGGGADAEQLTTNAVPSSTP